MNTRKKDVVKCFDISNIHEFECAYFDILNMRPIEFDIKRINFLMKLIRTHIQLRISYNKKLSLS